MNDCLTECKNHALRWKLFATLYTYSTSALSMRETICSDSCWQCRLYELRELMLIYTIKVMQWLHLNPFIYVFVKNTSLITLLVCCRCRKEGW